MFNISLDNVKKIKNELGIKPKTIRRNAQMKRQYILEHHEKMTKEQICANLGIQKRTLQRHLYILGLTTERKKLTHYDRQKIREQIVHYFIFGYSFKEIADKVDYNVNTVRKIISAIRYENKEVLEQWNATVKYTGCNYQDRLQFAKSLGCNCVSDAIDLLGNRYNFIKKYNEYSNN